jgi:type IV pilus assembly protein PilY1
MIFVGSNDGMLHAFRDCDGKEAWAFIPDNVLPNLKYLRESTHLYLLDSAPTAYVHDVNGDNIIDTVDKVVLIFGLGRGGGRSTLDASGSRGAYYALDVSNPLVPVLLWKVDSTTSGFAELGETWSPPRLAKVKDGSDVKVVAFVGAGYDNNEDIRFGNNELFPDTTTATTNVSLSNATSGNLSSPGTTRDLRPNPRGRGIFAIKIATLTQDYGTCTGGKYCPDFSGSGSLIWSFVKANDNGQGMDYSIPSDLTVLDMNNDGFQDRIYVGDTGGRLWRFDVGSTNTAEWTGRIIFNSNKIGGETNTGRKIFYRPTVALLQGVPTLYFGTGDRSHPLNMAVTDRMFAVKDKGQLTANYIDIDNLQDLTSNLLQDSEATETQINDILANLSASTNYGWYVDLENPGEKVLASALVFNKQAFYTTYTPLPTDNLDVCQLGNLGISRLYQLNYSTAEAVQNYYADNDNSTTYANNLRAKGGDGIALQREDRVRNIGEGIPSGIVTLIDASGKVTLMISSSNRVGTYQAPDAKMITPLYWIKY